MRTPQEIIRAFGIELTDFRAGNHKTRCPQCSDSRKHKKDKCLSVKIDSAGVTWNCYNCHWRPDQGFLCEGRPAKNSSSYPKALQRPYGARTVAKSFSGGDDTKVNRYKALQRAAQPLWRP